MLREAQEGRHVILPSSLYTPLEKLFNTSLGYPKHYQKIPKKFSDKTSDILCYMLRSTLGQKRNQGRCTGTNRTPLSSGLSPSPPIQNASMNTVRAENRPACQSPSVEQYVPRSEERNNIHVIQKPQLNPCPQQCYC